MNKQKAFSLSIWKYLTQKGQVTTKILYFKKVCICYWLWKKTKLSDKYCLPWLLTSPLTHCLKNFELHAIVSNCQITRRDCTTQPKIFRLTLMLVMLILIIVLQPTHWQRLVLMLCYDYFLWFLQIVYITHKYLIHYSF